MSEADEREPPRRRRRQAEQPPPGKRRRGCGCLVRLPVYLLLLVGVAGAGLYFWAQSEGARDAARRTLEARLFEYFDREVRVGEVRWTLVPLSVELEDLVIPSPPGVAPADAPFARVPHLRLQLRLENWLDWRQPILHVEQVFVESPSVHLVLREDGTNNLPRFGRGEGDGGGRRLEVRLGALIVEEGLFRLNELEVPLDLSTRSVLARLEGMPPEDGDGLVLDGRATAQDLEITLPGGRPYRGTVSVRTRIGPDEIAIRELLLRGPDLSARARGELTVPEDDRRLELSVTAGGTVALAAHLGYLDPAAVPLAGPFRYEGSVAWRPEGWSVEGELDSERLVYDRRVLTDVTGFLRVVPDALRYRIDRAGYADGTFSGVVRGELTADPLPFEIDLSLDGLSLQALAADQGLPLEGLSGRIGGEVSYRFTTEDAVGGSGWADLAVRSARTAPVGEELALTGRVPLEIDRGRVHAAGVRLASTSGDQLLEVEGDYEIEAGTGRFDYRLSTRDVGPLAALFPEEEPPPAAGDGTQEPPAPLAWLPTAGAGEATGTFRLDPGTYAVAASFELTGVEAPGLLADRLEGSLRLTPTGVRDLLIEASRGDGALILAGAVPFVPEDGTDGANAAAGPPPPTFRLDLDAAGWPADERLAVWLPVELPLAGGLSGHLGLTGDPEGPVGGAELAIEPATVAGLELDRLTAAFGFDAEQFRLERLAGHTGAGVVTARGTLGIATGALDFEVDAPRLDLEAEPFAAVLQGEYSGRLSLRGTIGGTLERPGVEGTLTGEELVVGGHRVGDDGTARVELAWADERLSAEGGLPGVLRIEGGGPLTPERADLTLRLASERLGDALRAAVPGVPEGLRGGLSGELRIAGEPARPEELLVRFEAADLRLAYEDRAVRNVEPVVVRLTGDAVEVDSLFLTEAAGGSELFVQGSIGLAEGAPLDLRTQGSFATDWVELLVPDMEMDGTFDLLATIGGTLEQPKLNGQGELRQGHLIVPGFPQSFEDLHAVVLFYPDQVVLDRLESGVGGGSLRAFGRLGLYGPGGLDYRMQATLQEVTLRYPEGFWFESDAALTLVSTPEGRQLRGTVTLDRAFYVQDLETGLLQILRSALRAERLEVAEVDEIAASTQLALSVQAPGTVRVRNNLADLEGMADLTVRGTLARPVVFGTIEFEQGGTLIYEDSRFEVERARLTFADPARIEPVVDLLATTEVRQYDVTLELSGKIDNLQVRVASDPPLSDLDVFSLLSTGQAPETGLGSAVAGTDENRFSPGSFLAGQAAAAVTERVGTLFGFDRLRITPPESGTGSGTAVTVGKRLSKNVVVTYTERSATNEEKLLRVEWQVDQNLTLVLSSGTQNTFRVDARWERRF